MRRERLQANKGVIKSYKLKDWGSYWRWTFRRHLHLFLFAVPVVVVAGN
jgi:hypothetical protein